MKIESVNWEFSFIKACFGKCGISGLWCKDQNESFLNRFLPESSSFPIETFMVETEPVVTEEGDLNIKMNEHNNTLEVLDYQEFDAGIKVNDLSKESPCRSKNVSMKTLMEEVKPLVTDIIDCEFWNKSFLLGISRTFRHLRFWCKVQSRWMFSWIKLSQRKFFWDTLGKKAWHGTTWSRRILMPGIKNHF